MERKRSAAALELSQLPVASEKKVGAFGTVKAAYYPANASNPSKFNGRIWLTAINDLFWSRHYATQRLGERLLARCAGRSPKNCIAGLSSVFSSDICCKSQHRITPILLTGLLLLFN
jgi:hypothetical protein